MGRPKAVNIDTFHLYDKLHTKKTKMMSGVEMTTLYPIKETEQFYMSIEVWAYCASKFKHKKEGFTLSVDIPVISDQKTIDFLDKKAKHNWMERRKDESETKEIVAMLDRLYPNHKKAYFYELDSIISGYNNGAFLSYDKDGNIEEPTEHDIKERKYYTHKYNRFYHDVPEIKQAYEAYDNETDQKKKTEKFSIYSDLEENYAYENNCLDDVFLNIGKNSVCYPVAFTRNTAEWSKEKYGKLIGYAHAGEIYFVVTPDTIYFEVKRHF